MDALIFVLVILLLKFKKERKVNDFFHLQGRI